VIAGDGYFPGREKCGPGGGGVVEAYTVAVRAISIDRQQLDEAN